MANRFDGKVALVTGAASGIGEACAFGFAKEGAKVLVSDVAEGGQQVAERINAEGGEAFFVACDVSDEGQVRRMVDTCMERWGRLDAAVNNAGIGGPMAMLADYTTEDWHRVININFNGVYYGMHAQIPAMLKNGGGAIVNVSSILGTVGFPQAPAYVSAKHGVMGMTKAAAVEYGAQGIRVNSVNPGFIETPLLTSAGIGPGTEMHDFLVTKHPIGRLGKAHEVANAILWLCSEDASFVSGTGLLVDGGYTAV